MNLEQNMFCYQCQETAGCRGCTRVGVCGKTPDVAAMQDLLVYVTKGLSAVTTPLRKEEKPVSAQVNHLITLNLFTTITNANFDKEAIEARIRATLDIKKELMGQLSDAANLPEAALWDGSGDWEAKARTVGVLSTEHEDIRSLRELITYGLKGLSAYSKHANALLQDDGEVDAFLQRALAATLDDSLSVDELVALTLETGKYGVSGMALLDNTTAYGNPEITRVNIGVGKNPGILVSGHDLRDLEMLLQQTQGTGVDVYTHSEMLPAHYYPAFKKYPNFVGNYGNAWWKQKEEFESFRGPILMTTNCIVPPKDSYKDRLYTTGAAGYPGCRHIPGGIGEEKDFSAIIEHAKRCAPPEQIEQGEIVGGFAHNQVLALADQIVDELSTGRPSGVHTALPGKALVGGVVVDPQVDAPGQVSLPPGREQAPPRDIHRHHEIRFPVLLCQIALQVGGKEAGGVLVGKDAGRLSLLPQGLDLVGQAPQVDEALGVLLVVVALLEGDQILGVQGAGG